MSGSGDAAGRRVLGMNVRRMRLLRGWTQAAMSADIDVDVRTIQKLEHGQHSAHEATLIKIATAFGCSVRDLFQSYEPDTEAAEEEAARIRLTEMTGLRGEFYRAAEELKRAAGRLAREDRRAGDVVYRQLTGRMRELQAQVEKERRRVTGG